MAIIIKRYKNKYKKIQKYKYLYQVLQSSITSSISRRLKKWKCTAPCNFFSSCMLNLIPRGCIMFRYMTVQASFIFKENTRNPNEESSFWLLNTKLTETWILPEYYTFLWNVLNRNTYDDNLRSWNWRLQLY